MNSIAFSALLLASFSINSIMSIPTMDKFCGPKLTQAMKEFCRPGIRHQIEKGNFPGMHSQKRSYYQMEDDLNEMNMPMNFDNEINSSPYGEYSDEYSNDPYMNYLGLFNKKSKRASIIETCCRNPCTLSTLITFCPV